ncbi:sulfite exporter TauE/SafE family protein [Paenibacillus eucommiae]|uniref:Probable membrane transporter protein n=1 Tax=Paenibacillus eucommiae TaxID=1355755 RepID=A0ABS4J7P4_9BACL|nr:sulfite exporter TauE/SafE family protein [Paenibacillus eucommiae]MBP1995869.1 putative membrane protein YfcA [Paenibacillus eucommiae]
MVVSLILLLVGIFAGVSGSIVGLGGGFIVVPVLSLMFPEMIPAHIVGTSMAMLFFNSISSTVVYAKQKRIDYNAAVWFAVAAIPGSVIGAFASVHIAGKVFFTSFGIFLILVSLFLVFKPKKQIQLPLKPTVHRSFIDASGSKFEYAYNRTIGVSISFLVGFLSSLFGVGGGSLMVPTMALLLSFPPHIAIATSMFNIFLSAIVSGGTHWFLDNIDWMKVLFLSPGAIIGGQIGARLAKRLPAKTILRILSIVLIIVALRLIFQN